MMVLMVLVIAMFVIVGAYVGYHASQQVEEEGKAHDINVGLEILDQDSGLVQILQNPEFKKSLL
ncbi:hypothetical protein K0U27_00860 [archaeon]|nr:hypothetical protein [archaeon]